MFKIELIFVLIGDLFSLYGSSALLYDITLWPLET